MQRTSPKNPLQQKRICPLNLNLTTDGGENTGQMQEKDTEQEMRIGLDSFLMNNHPFQLPLRQWGHLCPSTGPYPIFFSRHFSHPHMWVTKMFPLPWSPKVKPSLPLLLLHPSLMVQCYSAVSPMIRSRSVLLARSLLVTCVTESLQCDSVTKR